MHFFVHLIVSYLFIRISISLCLFLSPVIRIFISLPYLLSLLLPPLLSSFHPSSPFPSKLKHFPSLMHSHTGASSFHHPLHKGNSSSFARLERCPEEKKGAEWPPTMAPQVCIVFLNEISRKLKLRTVLITLNLSDKMEWLWV